ncbi:hypothetical protein Salat_0642800 [Sesamum alatum]|uniref:Uncharacterized protein n=1 Tax=Sesamum alatum TaxID=300844 RepID=A0AAE1YRB0_9LAMI|nr:hypothetical protein Salat_0642800 [Sesamum alatum]
MKQKIVIKVWTDGQRCRSKGMKIVIYVLKLMLPYDIIWKKSSISTAKMTKKAMKIAVTSPGVASVALTGEEKNQLVVTGEGVDAVNLTRLIRQNVSFAEVLSVGLDGGKE